MNDLVSIIMPAYNTEQYITDTINSILEQTYSNWELIIVDDCSTDNTAQIIKTFDDNRIRYIKSDTHKGAGACRNRALKEAEGKWVAFLDSDDLWHPQKLEKQLHFMKENGYKFTCTDYRIKLNGKWLPYVFIGPKKVNKRKMKDYCYFSTITVMYDREAIGLVQIEPIEKNNDYAMWLRVIEKAPCYRLNECLSYYIKHDGSITSGSKFRLIKHHYYLWRVAEHKNPVSATVLTFRNLFWGVIKKFRYKKRIEETD